ncbi:MAG: TIGR03617 family F420-dependent LLM class oxidoreductase [Hyphomicrobiales bacterium]
MGFTVGVNLTGEGTGLLDVAARQARRLEEIGFDAVEFAESAHDPFLGSVLAAEATSSLQVHTSVAIAFPRSPMVAAMLAWDLQRFSDGRFVMGLGTQVKGHNERRFSVPWSAPAPRMREYVQSLRAIWNAFQTGVPLEYAGNHYSFSLMTANFNPGPIPAPFPLVELAAVNRNNARVAGEVCDGIRLHPFHSPAYLRNVILPAVEAGLRSTGRARETFRVRGGGLVATGPDWPAVEQAVMDVKRWISFYGSTAVYHPVLEQHGALELGQQLRGLSLQGRWDEMRAAVPDELVTRLAVVAPYDRLASEFRARYRGLVDHLTFNESLLSEPDDDALRALVKDLQSD